MEVRQELIKVEKLALSTVPVSVQPVKFEACAEKLAAETEIGVVEKTKASKIKVAAVIKLIFLRNLVKKNMN